MFLYPALCFPTLSPAPTLPASSQPHGQRAEEAQGRGPRAPGGPPARGGQAAALRADGRQAGRPRRGLRGEPCSARSRPHLSASGLELRVMVGYASSPHFLLSFPSCCHSALKELDSA